MSTFSDYQLIKEGKMLRRSLPKMIEDLERREIRKALRETYYNKAHAAKLLGISRKGLIDRLKRLGMWDEFGK